MVEAGFKGQPSISFERQTYVTLGDKRIERVMRAEFHWGDLHVNRGLDGIISEMRFVP